MIRQCFLAGLLAALAVSTVTAQPAAAPANKDDPMARPTEQGFRLTPGLARLMARQYTGHLTGSFELDKSKADEASEKVARRIMQMFHQVDGPAQELIERFMEEQISASARGEHSFVPRGFGKEFAERVLPLVPAIRDLARGTVQDVRPMLPLKQQLKLAGEMMAFNTGMDAFEERMREWSNGQVSANEDPFDSRNNEIKLDEQGQSSALKRAREQATKAIGKDITDGWEQYVKDAKSFYGFDTSQSATADSILRECIERADQIRANEEWRTKYYRNRVWQQMISQIPGGWNNPFRPLLEQEKSDLSAGMESIGDDLKARIDRIPTTAQRRNAEQRMESLLAEKGLDLKASLTTTQPGGAQ
jgi:hypothetical protein